MWITVLIVLGALLFFGFRYVKASQTKKTDQGLDMQKVGQEMIYTVKRGDFQKTITSIGYLSPIRAKDLYFFVSGTIDEIYVKEGEKAEKGKPLFHIEDKKYRLDYIVAKNNYDEALIGGSEKKIKEKKLQLEIAEDNLSKTTLFAPFSGLITEVYVDVGDHITTNTKIVHIIDNTTYTIDVDVNETDIRFVKIGQKAEITLDAFPSMKFYGKVTGISYESKTTQGVVIIPVTITLSKGFKGFKPGLSSDVDIITQLEKDRLIIPETAVLERGKSSIVLKIVDGKPKPQPVRIKATNGIYALIEKGLSEGDKIIVNVAKFRQGRQGPNPNFRMIRNFR